MPIDLSQYYEPHAGQWACHNSNAKVKVLQVGRRWGKSRFSLFDMLKRFYECLDEEVPTSVVPPFHAWIVVPSFPQARQTWTEILSFVPPESIFQSHQEEMMIDLVGSAKRAWGRIELKSAHNQESLQTVGLDFLWVMEAQDIQETAFEKLLPTLKSPYRKGWAIFEGIPALYADHWFQRLYRIAERGRDGYFAYTGTTFDNPYLSQEQLEEIAEDKDLLRDASWRRMYMAEFSASAGYFHIDSCIAGDVLGEPTPGAKYVAGLDLGRKVDATVLHIMDKRTRRLVFERSWDAGQNWVVQREAVTYLCQDIWDVERLVVDATGLGDVFTQELAESGLPVEPFIFTAQSREHMLNAVAVAFERETIQIPPIASLLRQLRAMQSRRTQSGHLRVEAPPGEHDDQCFALGLALGACDAPEPIRAWRLQGNRYLPTQEEANMGTRLQGVGAKLMRDARDARGRERYERLGIEV